MSLYDFIYNLQRKPYKTKKRILAGLLVVSFILLSVFWVFMFKRQISRTAINLGGLEETVGGNNQGLIGPAAAIIEGIKGLKSNISQKIEELKSASNKKERTVDELPQN